MSAAPPDAATRWLDIDITVAQGPFRLTVAWRSDERFLGVFGHSGAGKTTLLETLAGLRGGAQGRIVVNGEVWLDSSRGVRQPAERRGVGYVPQDLLLYPHRDVMGNLRAGHRRAVTSGRTAIDERRVIEVLELSDLRRRDVASLSGGERQRVALGRALLSGASLLLLDEPLASLDLPLRRRILPYLVRAGDAFGIPTLYVSHDATEIRVLCAEVLVLSAGRAVALGPPDDVFTGETVLPMARAEGFENILRARVTGMEEGVALAEVEPGCLVRLPGRGLEGAREVAVALRAEDLILSVEPPAGLSAQNVVRGRIREIRETTPVLDATSTAPQQASPAEVLALVSIGETAAGRGVPIVVSITRQACRQLCLSPGRPVHIIFKTQACRILAAR